MFELLEFRGKIPKLKKIKIRVRVNGLKFLNFLIDIEFIHEFWFET